MTTTITLRPAESIMNATVATIMCLDHFSMANFKMIMIPDNANAESARLRIEEELLRIVDSKAKWENKIKSILKMNERKRLSGIEPPEGWKE